jgi:signal transduction histidine kinase
MAAHVLPHSIASASLGDIGENMPVASPARFGIDAHPVENGEFRFLAASLLAAQEEERRRVSCELHDELGQRLALLEIQVEQMDRRIGDDARVHLELQTFRAHLARISDDVHRICCRLHPVILENLGLIPALRSYCEEYSAWSGVKARFVHCGIPSRLPPAVALCLYRVVQEALRNVARHSAAKRALVMLRPAAHGLEIVIRDRGRGFHPDDVRKKGGLGLISLSERIRLSGGVCSIQSAPGRGTRIQAILPLAPEGTA